MAFSGEGTGVFVGLFLHRISSNQTFFLLPNSLVRELVPCCFCPRAKNWSLFSASISYVGAILKMIPTLDANIQVPVFPLSSHVMWTFFSMPIRVSPNFKFPALRLHGID